MKQNYNFKIEKIKDLSPEEMSLRKKNLELFYQTGFPNKKDEDWKFSDLNSILSNNFEKIVNDNFLPKEKKLKTIDKFQHNYISLFNGKLTSTDFSFEDKDKISIVHNYLAKKIGLKTFHNKIKGPKIEIEVDPISIL